MKFFIVYNVKLLNKRSLVPLTGLSAISITGPIFQLWINIMFYRSQIHIIYLKFTQIIIILTI